jgi:hypothetical protein
LSQANPHIVSSRREDSELNTNHQTNGWDQPLSFAAADPFEINLEPASLSFTSSSSLAALTGDLLFESHAPFMDAVNWNALSSLQTTDTNPFPINGDAFESSSRGLPSLSTSTFGDEVIHDRSLSQYTDQGMQS